MDYFNLFLGSEACINTAFFVLNMFKKNPYGR